MEPTVEGLITGMSLIGVTATITFLWTYSKLARTASNVDNSYLFFIPLVALKNYGLSTFMFYIWQGYWVDLELVWQFLLFPVYASEIARKMS